MSACAVRVSGSAAIGRGDRELRDRSSAPRRVANRTPAERVEVIAKLRRLRMTAAEIAETLGMPLSTVSGILTRIGMGRLGRLGLEPAGPLRALPARRARPPRRQEARPDRTAARATLAGRDTPALHRPLDRRGRRRATRSAGSSSTSPSTTTAGSPTPRSSTTRRPPPRRLPPPRASPSTAATASRSSASSPTTAPPTSLAPRARLPQPRHPTHPHPPLPATDKRQSRTLHPHDAQRLGLRRHLRLKPRTHRRP